MKADDDAFHSVASTSIAEDVRDVEAGGATGIEARTDSVRWELLGELGWGGMGRVLLVHDRWLGRDVAMKEPRTPTDAEALRREALITARLDHPGIVPIFDTGTSPDGRPWFAMRLVRGESLALLLERATASDRVRLLRSVLAACEAVAYAHARGVIHRDLTPANLMIGELGESQVIDWGLAITLDAAESSRHHVGTPRYMSPEQARGEVVGAATDVFSLGVILFHVVSGRQAFPEPDAVSVLAALRAGRIPRLSDGSAVAPPELCAIVERAMAAAPGDRYPSARELALDLARFLDRQRVEAYSYSAFALLRRVVRAWRVPLLVAALALAVLIVVILLAVTRITDERSTAERRLGLGLATAAAAAAHVEDRGGASVLAAHALSRAPLPGARGVLAAMAGPAPRHVRLGDRPCPALDLAGDRVLCPTPSGVGVFVDGRLLWDTPVRPLHGAMFIDHGRTVAVGPGIHLLDALTGEPVHEPVTSLCSDWLLPAYGVGSGLRVSGQCIDILTRDGIETIGEPCRPSRVAAAGLAVDGRAWAALCRDGDLVLGTTGDSRTRRSPGFVSLALAARVSSLTVMSGGTDLLIGTHDGAALRADPRRGDEPALIDAGTGFVRRIEIDHERGRALVVRDFGGAALVDIDSTARLGRLRPSFDGLARMDADGTVTVLGDSLERWDFAGVRPTRLVYSQGIASLAVSPDGSRLAVASGRFLALADPVGRERLAETTWQDVFVKDVAFSPDGRSLVAHGLATRPTICRSVVGVPLTCSEVIPAPKARRLLVLAGGAILAASYDQGTYLLETGAAPVRVFGRELQELVASADGTRVAAIAIDGTVYRARDLERGGTFVPCGLVPEARALAFDPDSDAVFILAPDGVTAICSSTVDATRYRVEDGAPLRLHVSRTWVAVGGSDGVVRLWRRGDPAVRAQFRSHDSRVSAIAIDPAERWLVSGGWDGAVVFWAIPPPDRVDPAFMERLWGLDFARALEASDVLWH